METISKFACALPWDPKTHENCIFLAKWAPTSGSWGTSHCYSVSKSIYLQLYKANATAYITSNIEENSHGSGSKHGIHFHHQFFEIFQKTCKVGTLGRPWGNCFDNSPGQMEASGAQILHAPIYKFILKWTSLTFSRYPL